MSLVTYNSQNSINKCYQTPLAGNPLLIPGQKHGNQSSLGELSTRWALTKPVDKPPQSNASAGIRTVADSTFKSREPAL